MNEETILKAKTSQINNIFFCLTMFIALAVLAYFNNTIISLFESIFTMLDGLIRSTEIPIKILTYIMSICFIGFPLFLGIWKILQTHFKTYTFTNQRLIIEFGVLTRKRDQTEYYRIKDKYSIKTIFLRPFGLSHFFLVSTDRTHPFIKVKAIKNLKSYEKEIRDAIEISRQKGQGREIEIV
jgi:uncharacterized membrane protein YdbT with pleckstrin-like domain